MQHFKKASRKFKSFKQF